MLVAFPTPVRSLTDLPIPFTGTAASLVGNHTPLVHQISEALPQSNVYAAVDYSECKSIDDLMAVNVNLRALGKLATEMEAHLIVATYMSEPRTAMCTMYKHSVEEHADLCYYPKKDKGQFYYIG